MLTQEIVKKISSANNEPQWFLKKRLEALDRYQNIDVPVFKYGIGIFLDTRDISLDSIDPIEKSKEIVKCSNGKIKVFSFREAFRSNDDTIKKYFMTAFAENNKI